MNFLGFSDVRIKIDWYFRHGTSHSNTHSGKSKSNNQKALALGNSSHQGLLCLYTWSWRSHWVTWAGTPRHSQAVLSIWQQISSYEMQGKVGYTIVGLWLGGKEGRKVETKKKQGEKETDKKRKKGRKQKRHESKRENERNIERQKLMVRWSWMVSWKGHGKWKCWHIPKIHLNVFSHLLRRLLSGRLREVFPPKFCLHFLTLYPSYTIPS